MSFVVIGGARVVQGAEWVVMGGAPGPVPAGGPLPYSPRLETGPEPTNRLVQDPVNRLKAAGAVSVLIQAEDERAVQPAKNANRVTALPDE